MKKIKFLILTIFALFPFVVESATFSSTTGTGAAESCPNTPVCWTQLKQSGITCPTERGVNIECSVNGLRITILRPDGTTLSNSVDFVNSKFYRDKMNNSELELARTGYWYCNDDNSSKPDGINKLHYYQQYYAQDVVYPYNNVPQYCLDWQRSINTGKKVAYLDFWSYSQKETPNYQRYFEKLNNSGRMVALVNGTIDDRASYGFKYIRDIKDSSGKTIHKKGDKISYDSLEEGSYLLFEPVVLVRLKRSPSPVYLATLEEISGHMLADYFNKVSPDTTVEKALAPSNSEVHELIEKWALATYLPKLDSTTAQQFKGLYNTSTNMYTFLNNEYTTFRPVGSDESCSTAGIKVKDLFKAKWRPGSENCGYSMGLFAIKKITCDKVSDGTDCFKNCTCNSQQFYSYLACNDGTLTGNSTTYEGWIDTCKPADCEIKSYNMTKQKFPNKNKTDEHDACSLEVDIPFTNYCDYGDGTRIENYRSVFNFQTPAYGKLKDLYNLDNASCYLTTQTEFEAEKQTSEVSFSGNISFKNMNTNMEFIEKTDTNFDYGTYIKPSLSIEVKKSYKLHITVDSSDTYGENGAYTAFVKKCFEDAEKIITAEKINTKKFEKIISENYVKGTNWEYDEDTSISLNESNEKSLKNSFETAKRAFQSNLKPSGGSYEYEFNYSKIYAYQFKSQVCYNSNSITTVESDINTVDSCANLNLCDGNKGYIYASGNIYGNNNKIKSQFMAKIANQICEYNVIEDSVNIEYRPISLDNPFPGQNGDGSRKTGFNWNDDSINTVIKNSDRIDTDNPMYIIKLTSENILDIRNNVSRDYTQDITEFGKSNEENTCELLSNSNSENISYRSGLITEYSKENKITGRCVGKNREKLLCIDN